MPSTEIFIYQKEENDVPLLAWLDELPTKVKAKCLVQIDNLRQQGSELRRPLADYLRDGIYELRIRSQNINYRILYAFVGQDVALLSHGLIKKAKVPPAEIDLALERKALFETDPEKHTYRGEL